MEAVNVWIKTKSNEIPSNSVWKGKYYFLSFGWAWMKNHMSNHMQLKTITVSIICKSCYSHETEPHDRISEWESGLFNSLAHSSAIVK